MKLSIITINFNNRNGLEKTIESVTSQTCKDFEWIIIDGGSTDGSRELVEKKQKYITYWCSEPDSGIYNAMNKGIKKAKGDYCFFLNSGDRLHDKDVMMNVLGELDGTDFVSGNVWCVNDQYDFLKLYKTPQVLTQYYMLELTLGHQCTFIKTIMLKEHPYDESLKIVADWEEMFYEFLINKRSYKHIDIIISDYPVGGVADQNSALLAKERSIVRDMYLTKKEQDIIMVQHFFSQNDEDSIRRLVEVAYTAFANKNYTQTEYKEIFGNYWVLIEQEKCGYQKIFVELCLTGKMRLALFLYQIMIFFKR